MLNSKEDDNIYLKGIGFSGFRSIGEKPIFLYPLKKINLIIGKNNSGKSNITLFLSQYLNNSNNKYEKIDYHKYDTSIDKKIFFPIEAQRVENTLKTIDNSNKLIEFLESDIFYYDEFNKIFWDSIHNVIELSDIECPKTSISYAHILNQINSSGTIYFSDERYSEKNLIEILKLIYLNKMSFDKALKIKLVPAIRELFNKVKSKTLEGMGQGIISKMAYLQHPNVDDQKSIEIFDKIQNFLKEVLEDQKIQLIVPDSKVTLHIKKADGKRYELSQLGTGIHEIIYLAFITSMFPCSLICIDEPELHMHPRLQKNLINYLNKNTDCQYVITTHSAHLIDATLESSIFRASMNKIGETEIVNVISEKSKFELVNELGYKASDIFQSNCILWVEGPSDRLYLNYWIHGMKPTYIEGIHYTIMFYGGRLLSHLDGTSDIDNLSEKISLLKINQSSFIIMDSDKASETASINDTKTRIIDEFKDTHWITEGREIENYLDSEKIKSIITKQCPNDKNEIYIGKYKNQLKKEDGKSFDKVKFAKLYIEENPTPDYSLYDLNSNIEKIVNFINIANN